MSNLITRRQVLKRILTVGMGVGIIYTSSRYLFNQKNNIRTKGNQALLMGVSIRSATADGYSDIVNDIIDVNFELAPFNQILVNGYFINKNETKSILHENN